MLGLVYRLRVKSVTSMAEAYTTQPNKERARKVLYIYLAWRVDRWDNKERYTYEPPRMRNNAVRGGGALY